MRGIERVAGLSTLLLATATPATVQEPDARVPEFPIEVEVVVIDVTVVDKGGRPVRGLRAEDFEVEVEGEPRRIVSLEFVAAAEEAAEAAPVEPLPPGLSSNADVAPGRLVLIAIDQSLIQPFGARFVTDAAGTLLDRLTPADRVGLVTFPPPGPTIDFTADRDEVREALEKVVGRSDLRRRRITLTEALSYTEGRDPHEWEKALRRECRVTSGRGASCVPKMESEAWQLVQEYENASRGSISTLKAIFDSLIRFDAPKGVVLISPGLYSEQRGLLRELGVKAAEAGVSLYALQLDQPVVDGASGRTRVNSIKDHGLLSEGLDIVAALSRGKVFRMIGDGERAFDRIARELSSYYLLGFAPEPGDRDGEVHDVSVEVARKAVEVRSRRVVRIPKPEEDRLDDKVRLARIASSPVLATELPLSAATYVTRSPESGRLRLLVSASAGDESLPASPAAVGFVLLDGEGNIGANEFREAADTTPEAIGPDRFLGAADIRPGKYTLRLAALDRQNRRGSVEHAVIAALVSAGGLELSDLMLGEQHRADAPFWPRASLVVGEGGLLYGAVEMFGEDPLLGAASVSFELTVASGGSVLLQGEPVPEVARGEGWRRIVGAFRTVALPPGSYQARAVVKKDGEILGAVGASFRIRSRDERTGARVSLANAAVSESEQAIAELWLTHLEGSKAEQAVGAEATAPAGQSPETAARYLDLVARYRGGEDTTTALEAFPLDDIRVVVYKLLSEPDSCPGAMCLEAAALMHTDAALTLLGRERVADTDSQLQTARWLLGFDAPLDDSSSDPQESEESVGARQPFRHTWLLAVGKLLMSLGYPSRALSYFEDCREFFPVGSLLAAGSAHELMGSVDGLVPVPAHPGNLFGQPPPPLWFEQHLRRAMAQALRAAETHYRRAIQLEPGVAEAHLRLGRVLQRRGRAEPARAELSWVVESGTQSPLLALAQLFLGELEERRGHLDQAIRRFRLALRAEPDSQAARLALSQALHRSGEMLASNEAARAVLVRKESGDSWLAYHLAFPKRAEAVMARLRSEVRR